MTSQNEEFDQIISSLAGAVPDAAQYARLSQIHIDHPLAEQLAGLDPFSAAYRSTAMELYLSLRGRSTEGYKPELHELAENNGVPLDIWKQASPWCFRSPTMAAEFLICWGQIMRLLDLPVDGTASVLEYGTGSGQLLLFLARMGIDVYAVDIDQPSLDLVTAQSNAMGLEIKCERDLFGEGFSGKTFDRIVFFEAFHHAWDFEKLLDRLSNRLSPGGLLVLCGEPVVSGPTPSIPFPWGPRLDALSVFCIRRFGWMELGFSEDFLFEVFARHGWLIVSHHIHNVGRASTYVARRAAGSTIRLGDNFSLSARFSSGWSPPEGTHRWTNGTLTQLPNPSGEGTS